MTILIVYVPAHHSVLRRTVLPGSAMVGVDTGAHRSLVDYEGNRYGAENMRLYSERLLHAAGRHVDQYPTVARLWARHIDLIEVGSYDYETRALTVTNPTELEAWCPDVR